MRIDFQEEILKFILQTKEGKKYRELLEKELWDEPTNQIVFDLYDNYVTKFNGLPSKVTLMEFFDREIKKKKSEKISREVYQAIEKQVFYLYEPFQEDSGLIKSSIVEFAQRKRAKNLLRDKADGVKEGDDAFFREFMKDMSEIVKMGETITEDPDKNRSGFLLSEFSPNTVVAVEGTPTFLRDLNKMTSAGGFKTPEHVVFMGAPKSYKTGTILKIALELVRDGERVYYADTENGVNAIKTRFYQGLMECERSELKGLQDSGELAEMVKRVSALGGDFQVGFFPAHTKTIDDLDAELEWLKETYNWTPTVIIIDYEDLFKSANPKITEKRLIIQDVYHHIVRLNNKWGTWALGVSPVSKNAVNKAVINMKDFGEDFAKAYNCHAAFAICRTEEEMEAGLARIIPVAQREGVPYRGANSCTIQINEARMQIDEVRMGEITKRLKNKKSISDD